MDVFLKPGLGVNVPSSTWKFPDSAVAYRRRKPTNSRWTRVTAIEVKDSHSRYSSLCLYCPVTVVLGVRLFR